MPGTPVRPRFCACTFVVLAAACVADAGTPTLDAGRSVAWTLSPEPVLEIGAADGPPELLFTTIANAFRAPDGQIVVANRASPAEVRVFSADGKHLRTFGRHGEGPGEYQAIAWVRAVTTDTIVAYDAWLHRVSWLSLTDGFARSRSTMFPGTDADWGALAVIAPARNGMFLARPNRILSEARSGDGRSKRPLLLARFDPPLRLDTLLTLEGAQFVTDDGEPRMPLFGARSAIAYRAGRVFVGRGDEFRIDEYTLDGTHLRTFERPFEPRPLTEDMVEAARTAALLDADAADRSRIEERYREMPRAERLPAHTTNILVDDTGHLWVEEYTAPGEPHAWSVFDPVGAYLCSVQVPADLDLTHVGRAAVFGVHRDELGVESVRVYELHR